MKNIPFYGVYLYFESSLEILRRRFPLPTLVVLLLTWSLLYLITTETESAVVTKIIFTSIVVFFFSMWMNLFLETVGNHRKAKYLNIIPILYGIAFYYTIDPIGDWWYESFIYFTLHLVGFISFILFSPYLKDLFYGKLSSTEYTNYFSRTAWMFLMSWIVGISLLTLWYIAIYSVLALFDLRVYSDNVKLYGYWAVLSLAFAAPIYGLTHATRFTDIEKDAFEVNRFFSFLIRFIAVPFIYIYFLILYAYTAKVLLNFSDWPKGMITWMVIGFSSFGYLTYIFSLAYEGESRLVSIFRRYFPYIVIPQILMLAYAISLRIGQYDLTMNRYFVVIFGLWLFGISLYHIFSKRKSLVSITASLALISLLISFGPWSVYRLPVDRQYARLIENLEISWILKDGKIQSWVRLEPTPLREEIYSGIEYVCDFSKCERIKTLFRDVLAKTEREAEQAWEENQYTRGREYSWPSKWKIISDIENSMRLDTDTVEESVYQTFDIKNSHNRESVYPLDVTGYNMIIKVDGENYISEADQPGHININPQTETMQLYLTSGMYRVTLDISEFNKKLRTTYAGNMENLRRDELTTIIMSDDYEIKLVLREYKILRNKEKTAGKTGVSHYNDIDWVALLKKLR